MPWPAAAVAASPAAAAYLVHRFGKALRLAANIAAFDSLLPRDSLISMVFERIFQQQVLLFLIETHYVYYNLEVAFTGFTHQCRIVLVHKKLSSCEDMYYSSERAVFCRESSSGIVNLLTIFSTCSC